MKNIKEIFGSMVFNDQVMRERLPNATYKSLHATIGKGTPLDVEVANVVANAMKDWAIEMGATHFTHWFQPLNGVTSEKHDSFISPTKDGRVIMEFSGKELVKGEPDASSFPSGGLRATCEARGYTAWDPTSYAFIKDHTLCIPTAFCSYSGEVLDRKTPLLRSMAALNHQALRILKLFGKTDIPQVRTTVGAEQEYFLVDRELYRQREDLILCGRTLFGAMPPKGQEMEDHYFGMIKPRVAAFMRELDEELWKLGISAKTEHNEAAPSQHELAPIFTTTNIAVDHNQLTMELMKKTAEKHGFACLLHEKPFEGVNGSGKHNNWSLSTTTGVNLLEPGETPQDNLQFLLFFASVVKAVDNYQDLLRISVATAGNDHRLGGNEAPPAIISMFIGEELEAIMDCIAHGVDYSAPKRVKMELGVDILPNFPKDTSDRNRTSPFAFTGNKFEFRMPGSNLSVASANIILNTAVAESLRTYADELEAAPDFQKAVIALVRRTINDHKRIIFNGHGYEKAWEKEARKRGLSNYKTTVDALPHYLDEKNIKLFTTHKIFTPAEVQARYEIAVEQYCKTIHIEALTLIDMVRKKVLPAIISYMERIATTAAAKKKVSEKLSCRTEEKLLEKLSFGADAISDRLEELQNEVKRAEKIGDMLAQAVEYKDKVLSKMQELRQEIDEIEPMVNKEFWKIPTYAEMLFSV